jgi:hypothetical protein
MSVYAATLRRRSDCRTASFRSIGKGQSQSAAAAEDRRAGQAQYRGAAATEAGYLWKANFPHDRQARAVRTRAQPLLRLPLYNQDFTGRHWTSETFSCKSGFKSNVVKTLRFFLCERWSHDRRPQRFPAGADDSDGSPFPPRISGAERNKGKSANAARKTAFTGSCLLIQPVPPCAAGGSPQWLE